MLLYLNILQCYFNNHINNNKNNNKNNNSSSIYLMFKKTVTMVDTYFNDNYKIQLIYQHRQGTYIMII